MGAGRAERRAQESIARRARVFGNNSATIDGAEEINTYSRASINTQTKRCISLYSAVISAKNCECKHGNARTDICQHRLSLFLARCIYTVGVLARSLARRRGKSQEARCKRTNRISEAR